MRTIDTHKINPVNDQLKLTVVDEPGNGGACHSYVISDPDGGVTTINFQNGPIGDVGVNGVTHEVLLAVLIDRLEHFQAGQYANDYNAAALDHLRSAQGALFDRTRERMTRGVEGTHVN